VAIALSTLLALSVTLSAEPDALTLGKDAAARIEVRVTGTFGRALRGAKVSLSTNLGNVGDLQPAGDGEFTATFTPPRSRVPAVALLAADAEVDGDHALGWLALPLAGSDSMTLETKPHAKVQLRIADRDFGPAVANAKGEVQVQVVVPPGVEKATMHVEDPLGNTADRQLDLDPPPFPRLRVLPVGPPQATSGEGLELQAFVVRSDGSPDTDARVTVSAERGEVDVSRNRRGIVTVSWQPPRGSSGQTAIELQAHGERAQVRASFASSGETPRGGWLRTAGVSAGLIGSAGSTFSGVPGFGGIAELAVPLQGTPFEALLDVGGIAWTRVDEPAPVAVQGGLSFATVSAVIDHTCGVTTAGAAYCWGWNQYGQLGDGTTTDRAAPVAVQGGLSFATVSAGDFHTCGLTAAGVAYCWGGNDYGQLGDGTTTKKATPVAVQGGLTFKALNAGGWHTCGITTDGVVYCWGANSSGTLGDGTTTNRNVPVKVLGQP